MQWKKRVLLVESVRDDVSKRRQRILFSDSIIRRRAWYSYAFCVEPEDLLHIPFPATPDEIIKDAGNFGTPLPLDSIKLKLYFRLLTQIKTFEPEYVLFYIGFVYRQFGPEIRQVIHNLKKKYPEIKFGSYTASKNRVHDPDETFSKDEDLLYFTQELQFVLRGNSLEDTINKLGLQD